MHISNNLQFNGCYILNISPILKIASNNYTSDVLNFPTTYSISQIDPCCCWLQNRWILFRNGAWSRWYIHRLQCDAVRHQNLEMELGLKLSLRGRFVYYLDNSKNRFYILFPTSCRFNDKKRIARCRKNYVRENGSIKNIQICFTTLISVHIIRISDKGKNYILVI